MTATESYRGMLLLKGPLNKIFSMPQLIPTIHSCLLTPNFPIDKKNIENILSHSIIVTTTGVLYTEKGFLVQDDMEVSAYKPILMDKENLEKRLGSFEESGVVFSDDKSVRFVPYGFKTGEQTPRELGKNPGVIAISGSKENAEKLTEISKTYKGNPWFVYHSNDDLPKIGPAIFQYDDSSDRIVFGQFPFDGFPNDVALPLTFS